MGRGGKETPRGLHDLEDAERSQSGPAARHGEIRSLNALRELGFPEKEGKGMEDGLCPGVLCPAGLDGWVCVPAAAHLRAG